MVYKFSSKANFGTQSGLWTVWCNAIENTYRLYVLTKMLLDIIDCWKLTSLIIALQMVGDLYLSAQLKLLCLVLAWKLKWITLSNIFVLSILFHTRVPKLIQWKGIQSIWTSLFFDWVLPVVLFLVSLFLSLLLLLDLGVALRLHALLCSHSSLHKSKKGLYSCSCGLYCIGEEANQSLRD